MACGRKTSKAKKSKYLYNPPMYFIYALDYILLPIYLLISWGLLNAYFKKRHGHNPELKKHFTRGLLLKLAGCIAIGMIYEYYYQGAYDGRFYFEGGKLLSNYWLNHPSEIVPVLFSNISDFNKTNLDGLNMESASIFADTSFFVCKITAIFNLFSFNSFLPASLFFCVFAFIALWNLFIFFTKEFDLTPKLAAFSTLYIPSVMIWGSSIFKDTITFSALCWLFVCGYYCFIKPHKFWQNFAGFVFAFFLIASIKVYIIAAFFPFFILYIFNSYKSKIRNQTIRALSTPFVLIVSLGSIFLFLQNAGSLLGRYSVDQVLETATLTNYNITTYGGVAGSAYTLNVDFSSPLGLLAAIPAGINITLFRPYPWEYIKPIILLASAESMTFLYFTLYILFKGGFGKAVKIIWKTPILQFCLLFSFLFAFMVGISAANFGTLVRYKIPCLPFYALFLALLYKLKFPASKQQHSVSKGKQVRFA